jgi:hypothetical protein
LTAFDVMAIDDDIVERAMDEPDRTLRTLDAITWRRLALSTPTSTPW